MLVIFAGCSGVGKDTIMKRIISDYPEEFAKFPSYTTREPREGESEGNPYCFIKEDEFLKKLENDEIFEYNYIHNAAYYGVSKGILNSYMATGKVLFKDVDVEGVRTYKAKLEGVTKTVSVYLYCSDEEMVISRLINRGDKPEAIEQRRQRFAMENELSSESDYMVNNMFIPVTAGIVKMIIDAEKTDTLWLPAEMPSESAIAAACEKETLEPVMMGYTGSNLVITEGADRYAAAVRTGRFVQKKVAVFEADESLIPCCGAEEWAKAIKG